MWQAYRHLYKPKAHNNQKVPWTSKWDNVADYGATVKEFLHLTATTEHADRLVMRHNPTRMVTPHETVSDHGSPVHATFSILKRFMAKVKHETKHDGVDKNMIILPHAFCAAAHNQDFGEMDRLWNNFVKYGKRLVDYNRVFICGHSHNGQSGHCFLIMIDFGTGRNKQPRECCIHTYDSCQASDHRDITRPLEDWIKRQSPQKWVWYLHRHVNQPLQHDGWNCGQYTIEFAKNLMRGRDCHRFVGLRHLQIPDNEPKWDDNPEKLYQRGRKDAQGNDVHPRLDAVLRHFGNKRWKRWAQLRNWHVEQMKAFA
jgi:hypothetical protein